MPVPPRKPAAPPVDRRIPNSQVAPGQRPYVAQGRPVASTHSTVPEYQATAGRKFRVRDKVYEGYEADCVIWGENLSYDDAIKLKEKITTSRQSKTARVEDMEDGPFAAAQPTELEPEASDDLETKTHPVQPVARAHVTSSPPIPRSAAPPPTATGPRPVPKQPPKLALDPSLEHLRARARHAGGVEAEAANVRHQLLMAKNKTKLPPMPKAPPSPLSDKILEDLPAGEMPGDEELLDDADLHAITGELGGSPTADDVKRAKAQRDADELARPTGETTDDDEGEVSA